MLTRLRVQGFKNLVDVEIHFGPLTCIAGPNGVGKSNLFDAILFLSALTDRTLAEAAALVRGDSERPGDVRGIFHRTGTGESRPKPIRFEADMILSSTGLDELGEPVEASTTLVRYVLAVGWREEDSPHRVEAGPLELLEESLIPLRLGDFGSHLLFEHTLEWRKSVLKGRHTAKFLSTEERSDGSVVRLHQDGRSGRLFARPAASLPRTLLSTVRVGEFPTAMLVRREMQSWRLLHLESSALRRPDRFDAPTRMTSEGAHLASALYHLSPRTGPNSEKNPGEIAAAEHPEVANRLAELIDDVRSVRVVRDPVRELLTLYLALRDGTEHAAIALSDGTLRFLALAVIEYDRRGGGVLCLEEPENGIHPGRIEAMLRLLQDIAVDPEAIVDEWNPLRQVIVNTHSPSVALQAPEDSLIIAELVETMTADASGGSAGKMSRSRALQFSCLEGTWRAVKVKDHRITGRGNLLAYLNPSAAERSVTSRHRRVMDRKDLQLLLTMSSGG